MPRHTLRIFGAAVRLGGHIRGPDDVRSRRRAHGAGAVQCGRRKCTFQGGPGNGGGEIMQLLTSPRGPMHFSQKTPPSPPCRCTPTACPPPPPPSPLQVHSHSLPHPLHYMPESISRTLLPDLAALVWSACQVCICVCMWW